MERRFDLVVIGTGVASAVASRCREAGWTVAVVDYRPFGGTCALRGCIPKKILVSAAEAVHGARTMADRGVRPGEVSIDWPDLIRVKRSVTDPVPARTEEGWSQAGVALFHGRARFVGPTTVEVGADRLIGRHVLIVVRGPDYREDLSALRAYVRDVRPLIMKGNAVRALGLDRA